MSKELRHTIGDFTGNILLEIKIDEKKTFIELAHEIQNQLMRDLEHSNFSGIKFQRELSKYDGTQFQYGIPFVYTSTLGMENDNDNLFGEICYNITQTPQIWLDYQIQERQGALYLNWDYLEGLFDETQIEKIFNAEFLRQNVGHPVIKSFRRIGEFFNKILKILWFPFMGFKKS